MRPSLHEFRIYGPRRMALFLTRTTKSCSSFEAPSSRATRITLSRRCYTRSNIWQIFEQNVGLFMAGDFHMDAGMKYLIESFYRSIREDAPLPISYREIVLTARIMDSIFEQVRVGRGICPLNLRAQAASK